MKILAGIVLVFLYLNIVECEEKSVIPWFINADAVYYIDTRQIYTSKEATDICVAKTMMYRVNSSHFKKLLKYIEDLFGNFPSFWTYDNEKYDFLMPYHSISDESEKPCYKLSSHDSNVHKTKCDEKMGLICKRKFVGASMYFVNGTRQEIEQDNVHVFCDPQSEDYDHSLQLCLVRFNKYMAR